MGEEFNENKRVIEVVQQLVSGFNLVGLLLLEQKRKEGEKRNGLSLTRVLCITKEIFQGIAKINEKGFFHRDLKCENVMITTSSEAKILDFSFARKLEEGKKASTPAFSPLINTPPEANF